MVVLNPGNFEIPNVIENFVHVYVICEDKDNAEMVSSYEMTSEKMTFMNT